MNSIIRNTEQLRDDNDIIKVIILREDWGDQVHTTETTYCARCNGEIGALQNTIINSGPRINDFNRLIPINNTDIQNPKEGYLYYQCRHCGLIEVRNI